LGLPAFLGSGSMPMRAFVQVAGDSFRLAAGPFRAEFERGEELSRLLLLYTEAAFNQVARSAACNRAHGIRERCARWLLATHDGVGEDRFELTQEFLAQMLGVRRAAVNVAAGVLQRAGFIAYARGRITIVDRAGLESAACECYGVIRGEYRRLLGGPGPPRGRKGGKESPDRRPSRAMATIRNKQGHCTPGLRCRATGGGAGSPVASSAADPDLGGCRPEHRRYRRRIASG
jgi:Crp-like helix-turn-helix domain